MTHRCSHCSTNGHNSRTCPAGNHHGAGGNGPNSCEANGPGGGGQGQGAEGCGAIGGVKLFGVRLTDGSTIKKSASMGNLSNHLHSNHGRHGSGSHRNDNPSASATSPLAASADGYLSDDPAHHGPGSSARRGDRKKGVPWTEEEHRMFLIGLQKLGKGDWRGISRHYVSSRTPTQVASHAQKYFIRQSNTGCRKRRSSLFDIPQDMANDSHSVHEDVALAPHYEFETEVLYSMPSLDLSLSNESSSAHRETTYRDATVNVRAAETTYRDATVNVREQAVMHLFAGFPPLFPSYFPGYTPVPMPLWPTQLVSPPHDIASSEPSSHHTVVKPTPSLAKQPVNADELIGMSQLGIIGRDNSCRESSSTLSLKLPGEPSRQSALRAKPPVSVSDLSKGEHNPIQAV